MRLYHGSTSIIKAPRILASDHIGDFGTGFYTTTDIQQARNFVNTKCDRAKLNIGYISIFEVSNDLLSSPALKVLIFQKADEKWVNFVKANRKQPDFSHDYDLIMGPVANDQVYASFALFEADLLSFEELIERLKTRKLTDQILFHTEKSLLPLKFIGSEVVECPLK